MYILYCVRRGGRPDKSISRPSHILLIFSSELPRNPRHLIIMCFKAYSSQRYIFCNLSTFGHTIWIGQSIAITSRWNLQTHENDFQIYVGKT